MKESQPIPTIAEWIQKYGAVNKCNSNKILENFEKKIGMKENR